MWQYTLETYVIGDQIYLNKTKGIYGMGNIFTYHISDKGLISEYINNFYISVKEKKWQIGVCRTFKTRTYLKYENKLNFTLHKKNTN